MRVAITLNTSWNIYNFRMGLIQRLLSEGHEVIAIAPKDRYSEIIEAAGCKFIPIKMDNTGSNPIADLKLFSDFKKIFKFQLPDIIFNFTIKPNIYGTLAAKNLGIPVINNVSGLGTVFLSGGIASFVAKLLYRKAFSVADVVFFQNKDDRQEFLSQIDISNLETDLLPGSGINLTTFEPKPMSTSKSKVFLLIARLIKDKGILEYIEAAKITLAKHPDAKFQLLGKLDPGHARGIPQAVIEKASSDGHIDYLGATSDVRPFIERASCIVLPSYREGTPRTLLEAAALARPVLATDVAGCREVVEDGKSGLLCESKNSADLAEKMMHICELPVDHLADWGMEGRKLIERKFDEQLVVDIYLSHMDKILNQIHAD